MSESNFMGPEIKEVEDIAASELVKRAKVLKPEFTSPREALVAAQKKLETLAATNGMSIEAFLQSAEQSSRHNESHIQALALDRQIQLFKSQIK